MSPEKKAVITASSTAVLLIVIKGAAGIMTGSMAIMTSAIDSLLDFFVSLMNFFAIRKSEEPMDDDHNYGHGKIEGFGALFEGAIISVSGGLVIFFSVQKIMTGDLMRQADESIIVMIFSIFVTFGLVRYLSGVAAKTNSLVIKADSLHYKSDLYTNAGIIISLVILKLTDMPLIDPVISIFIALYIIHGSIGIMKEGFDMLMDKSIDPEYIEAIRDIISGFEDIDGFHFLKTRRSGKKNFIEFHMVFKDVAISLKCAHIIGDKVELDIMKRVPHSHVTIHLDYYDDSNASDNPKLLMMH